MRQKLVIGNMVKIWNDGQMYSQYDQWAIRNGATNWKKDRYPNLDINNLFKIITIAPHSSTYSKNDLALIEDQDGKQFIYGVIGLQFIANVEYFDKEEFEV